MQYRNLGRAGLKISAIGLGTMQWRWRTTEEEAYGIMDAYLDHGGNFLDTANIYSQWVPELGVGTSETVIGNWLQARGNRERVVLATKVRGPMADRPNGEGLSRRHIIEALEDSLRRLQTDWVDLYQMHWFDAETPIEETLEALTALIRQGKVRYIGCSNYPAWRLMQALWASDKHDLHRFASLQPHYNLLHRREFEQELAEVCETYGIGVVPYSPMAGGVLTGSYSRDRSPETPRAEGNEAKYAREEVWQVVDAVRDIAEAHDTWPGAVALAWLLSRPAVTSPIVGANSIEQCRANLAAADLRLSREELDCLTAASDKIGQA